MSKTKTIHKNTNKSKRKRNKKNLSSDALRRQKIARAKIGSFLGAVSAIALVCVGIALIPRNDIPLTVDDIGYDNIAVKATVESEEILEIDSNGVPTNGTIELDEKMLDVGKIKFHTKSTYPIDMVIDSKYALVYDVTANEILFEKNADQSCFPASTTKLLTAAVALKNAPSDMVYTIGDELDLVSAGSSLAMLEKGNELDNEMMIDALMLPSGNDAAYGTAANIGKILLDNPEAEATEAVKAFVDEMNQTATYIGCENTNFTAPDGFHDPNHSTTLYDMLRISLYAGKFPMIETSVAKPYTRTTILSGEVFDWSNSNQLIQEYSDTYYYYANGMKTGMTDEAGYCVVASAERYSRQVICLVFGGTAADRRWNDTVALLDAAFVEIKKGLD